MTVRDQAVARETFNRLRGYAIDITFGQKALLYAAFKGTCSFDSLPGEVQKMFLHVGQSSERICAKSGRGECNLVAGHPGRCV